MKTLLEVLQKSVIIPSIQINVFPLVMISVELVGFYSFDQNFGESFCWEIKVVAGIVLASRRGRRIVLYYSLQIAFPRKHRHIRWAIAVKSRTLHTTLIESEPWTCGKRGQCLNDQSTPSFEESQRIMKHEKNTYFRFSQVFRDTRVNTFGPTALFLYLLKISEILAVFWCFQGVENGHIGNKWVK